MSIIRHAWSMGPSSDRLNDDTIAEALEAPDCAWVHLDASDGRAADWVEAHLDYLPAPVREALLIPQIRPRSSVTSDGILLILRGVNHNPGAEPEDMVSIRIWADPSRVVTLSLRHLRSVDEMAEDFEAGRAPATAGAFVVLLAERLAEKIETAVLTLEAEGDEIEDALLAEDAPDLRRRVGALRQTLVDFRRVLQPQQEAVARVVATAPGSFLHPEDRLRLGETDDDLRRSAEIVQALSERLVVLKDEMQHLSDQRLNRNLYILSVVSAVFLPLGFLTGLMGINLAGMPGASWPPAFWVFTGVLVLLSGGLLALLWRLRFVRTPTK